MLLVLSMNLTSNATVILMIKMFNFCQNLGVLYHQSIGYHPATLAKVFNNLLYLGFYMFLTTKFTVTVFRILLVIKLNMSQVEVNINYNS